MAVQAKTPYYKVFCTICGKSHPNRAVCPLVASQRPESERGSLALTADNKRQDWLQGEEVRAQIIQNKLSTKVERDLGKEARVRDAIVGGRDYWSNRAEKDEWKWENGWWRFAPKQGKWQKWEGARPRTQQRAVATTSAKRPSDVGSEVSDSAASISTAATLTLSRDEEMEARKLEAQLRTIDVLKERRAEGKPLTRWEESEIRRQSEIGYAPVMQKVLKGAGRCILDTDPLTKEEEEEVQKMEQKLRAIKDLQDRKADGEYLQGWQMREIRLKSEIESSSLMMRVRKGAARFVAPAPATAPTPAPASMATSVPATTAILPPAVASPTPAEQNASESSEEEPAKQDDWSSSEEELAEQDDEVSSEEEVVEQDDEVSSEEEPIKTQEPTLKQMVATIREELELEESLTTWQIIAEANLQLEPATGNLAQQAKSLYRQVAPS